MLRAEVGRMVGAVVVMVLLGGCGGASTPNLRIQVSPQRALVDRARTIVISGLRPGSTATISASTPRPGGIWSSHATYTANHAGMINLTSAAPVSGSYRGESSLGLLWSEQLTDPRSVTAPSTVTTLRVSDSNQRAVASTLTQLAHSPEVTERPETLRGAGFVGEFYSPTGSARRPAVVVWGGSEGGLGVSGRWAAVLASHDMPALALAYFDEPGLPCSLSDIPLEYFAKAIRWLRAQPQVNPTRVWNLSVSRGTEAELLTVAYWPSLVHGIVAAAPSSTGYGANAGRCQPRTQAAWTLHGRPVPHAVIGQAVLNANRAYDDRAAFQATLGIPTTAAARIPVGRFRGPALLISGGADQLWPSSTYADQIMHELRLDPAPHEHLNYPAAGHPVLGLPSIPQPTQDKLGQITLNLGGTPSADDRAHRADWPAMINFIASH